MTGRDFNHRSVVLIDEEPGRLSLLGQYVEMAGLIALPINNGPKGLQALSLINPEVVVINANLSKGITALELCKRINDPLRVGNHPMPVVIIAQERQPWFMSSDQTLVSDYLILPFTAYELVEVIRRLLALEDASATLRHRHAY